MRQRASDLAQLEITIPPCIVRLWEPPMEHALLECPSLVVGPPLPVNRSSDVVRKESVSNREPPQTLSYRLSPVSPPPQRRNDYRRYPIRGITEHGGGRSCTQTRQSKTPTRGPACEGPSTASFW